MPLSQFTSVCRNWFLDSFGQPTPAQAEAWPAIQAGRHTLIAAPTGSGKTLAAFYAVINALVEQGMQQSLPDGVQVVYVSPLKALSNDIYRNLEMPLDGIAEQLHREAKAPVDIRVAVRTGDTPQKERQKMAKNPPHILVTTPESLYLLLTSASGRAMLKTAGTLIIDEIHALLGDKRGSHLALSVERLDALVGGNLQRIGLSATQRPIELVARYLVGNGNVRDGQADCAIVDAGHRRELILSLEIPRSPLSALMSNEVWEELYQRLVQLIESHRTTLVFVNTRRLSERLALALTERLDEGSVCSHHGSMSKDHRHSAEQRLKAGELKVLVATASMELGIDVGAVDLVVQFASPKSIATFLQRVGRSGHSVGGTPKGILFPLTRDDLVECTALLDSIRHGELDHIVMPESPLDILSQQIVAEVAAPGAAENEPDSAYSSGRLFELFTNAFPYRDLSREQFDELLQMLSDGYTTRRGRRGAHLHLDQINDRVRPRRGSGLIALTNGGAIPDMFDYQVVLDPEDTVVGTLNEDFALEALPGDVFTLGTHSWQLLRVDGLKVRVRDAQGMPPTIPFWFGEGPGRTRELSEAVSRLRGLVAELLIDGAPEQAAEGLVARIGISRDAAAQLVEYLHAGFQALGEMPTRETLVMERFFDEVGDMHLVIHSPYGSRINRGWGLALRKRFCRTFNFELQAAANEDSIVISLGSVHSFELQDVFNYLQTASLRDVLVQALLDAPMFEVRWRWNATRALAIQRNRAGKRIPPQFQRMDAEDLVAHVFPDQIACFENIQGKREVPDHPLVNQTIHDCLTEAMDIEELTSLIGAIENRDLKLVARDLREPSPFAQEIINARPYAFLDDAPFEERRTNAIRNRSWLDPAETGNLAILDPEAIRLVREQAWPQVGNPDELHDALLSLGYMTESEIGHHQYRRYLEVLGSEGRACRMTTGTTPPLWLAAERGPCLRTAFPDAALDPEPVLPDSIRRQAWQPEEAVREIARGRLEGCGPVTATQLAGETGLAREALEMALLALEVEGYVFRGQFSSRGVSGSAPIASAVETEWCERRLLQRIHRYTIDAHRKAIKPVSLQNYLRYLFQLHQLQVHREASAPTGVVPALDGQTRLQASLALLDGIAAPAAAWEADIFPNRIRDYDPNWLDVMCISGRTAWGRFRLPPGRIGREERRKAGPIRSTPIMLVSRENLDIWQALASTAREGNEPLPELGHEAALIEQDLRRHGASFVSEILQRTGLLKTRVEQGLAELVSFGRATSDSFTGLRALLTPEDRKPGNRSRRGRRAMFGIEDAGRWSLLTTVTAAGVEDTERTGQELSDDQFERLVHVYLQRWGVLFRKVLERETFAPPWRVLLRVLRRLELQGAIRGGRFITGIGGEQFAYPDTVDELRRSARSAAAQGSDAAMEYVALAAADPVNLLSLMLPDSRLPRLASNRVLFADGVPLATLQGAQVSFLREVTPDRQWKLQQLLQQRNFPPRLRSYLGRQVH
ncbi:MAG: DEAD/DEAH box helicase [Gammaproteobacteria bacterium]|nr:DEAD/DEAH box helicase [Pseudomonadales bacterium]MCP5347561.1 DEAD/DEAH box helicase [Pseudomonadales bacterium]